MENTIKEARKIYSLQNPTNEMTQVKLAELVGINRVTLSKIERGLIEPSIRIALKIAQALDVNVTLLFSLENNERRRVNYRRNKNKSDNNPAIINITDTEVELSKLATTDFINSDSGEDDEEAPTKKSLEQLKELYKWSLSIQPKVIYRH